jgi:surface protein
VTTMRHMFENAHAYDGSGISGWGVDQVTDMFRMFAWTQNFNADLSGWNTIRVTNMAEMFRDSIYNNDLSSWNVGHVTTFAYMFHKARLFQGGDLSKWDLKDATSLNYMFSLADVFDGNVSTWITENSKVTTMSYMFQQCMLFKGVGLPTWNTGTVSNLQGLFDHNYVLNADLSKWDVSEATTMDVMFRLAKVFNSDISKVRFFIFDLLLFLFFFVLALSFVVQCFVSTKNYIFFVPPTFPLSTTIV